jgi:SAM-dependent methyltransferase
VGPDWRAWFDSPPGRYVLDWEQSHFDEAVADVFGYHAIQCGAPGLDALRANRMPHRVHAVRGADPLPAHERPRVRVEHFEELPFGTQSVDLLVLPHVLEFAHDPHAVLREADRVLRPEGRLIVSGFNPVSLWGLRHRVGRAGRGPGPGAAGGRAAPRVGGFIGYWRLRDWLRLLGFEVEAGRFGCYRPPVASARWLERWAWVEGVGERWWPVLGGVYFLSAVKRVRGMRLVGMARADRRNATAAPAVVARREATGSERP